MTKDDFEDDFDDEFEDDFNDEEDEDSLELDEPISPISPFETNLSEFSLNSGHNGTNFYPSTYNGMPLQGYTSAPISNQEGFPQVYNKTLQNVDLLIPNLMSNPVPPTLNAFPYGNGKSYAPMQTQPVTALSAQHYLAPNGQLFLKPLGKVPVMPMSMCTYGQDGQGTNGRGYASSLSHGSPLEIMGKRY